MIIALAGRRIDEQDAHPSRFPLRNAELVRKRLESLFRERNAKGLVCSAACGADLLALSVAEKLNLHSRIVLPFDAKKFRETSVIDRPGDWGEIFDKIYQRAKDAQAVVEIQSTGEDNEAYIETNNRILDEAVSLAEQLPHQQETDASENSIEKHVLVVIVWEGAARGDDDITADFAESGRARRFEVAEVLTK